MTSGLLARSSGTSTVLLTLLVAGCDHECLLPPCAAPLALVVGVTSAGSGGAVHGASIEISGAVTSTIPCDSSCVIPGVSGSYTLQVSAPGYQSLTRTVLVRGSNPECGCPIVETERITIALAPTP